MQRVCQVRIRKTNAPDPRGTRGTWLRVTVAMFGIGVGVILLPVPLGAGVTMPPASVDVAVALMGGAIVLHVTPSLCTDTSVRGSRVPVPAQRRGAQRWVEAP
jgi:hypothetical protein